MDLELALFEADHGQNLRDALTRARDAYTKRPSIHAADVLAWTLYQTSSHAEADKFSRESLRLGTRDPLMWYHAAMIALKLNDTARARELLQNALAQNPHFSILYAPRAQQQLDQLGASAGP